MILESGILELDTAGWRDKRFSQMDSAICDGSLEGSTDWDIP